jgi:hypothetical protein
MNIANMNTKFIPLSVVGFQIYDVPGGILKALRDETSEMIENNFVNSQPYNNRLAGIIEKEFLIQKSTEILNRYITTVAPIYWESTTHPENSKKKHLLFKNSFGTYDVWVNFQKRGEINPIHDHTGDLSFVIYLKLPYLLENEKNTPFAKNSNNPVLGTFNFIYPDSGSGGVETFPLPTDKNFEGKMIVFSSSLKHMVYPFFTSKDYRISISGNIIISNE